MSKSGAFGPSNGVAIGQSVADFTPTLLLGGANVGMSGTFTGRYVRTGKQVDISVTISLTALGSSTGSATVGNLPFASSVSPAANKWIPTYLQNSTLTATTRIDVAAQASSTSLTLLQVSQSAVIVANLTNTNLTDTSIIVVSGTYWTDL